VSQVLVLNASYEPLNVCSVRRAHVLVWKGKAEIVERDTPALRSAGASFILPLVIRLLQYVRVPHAVKRRISRRALFARDGWRCVYCGSSSGRLTLDHVQPRSKGGDSCWENVVTACAPCNLRKGDRTLEEARMTLGRQPKAPAPILFIRLALPRVPDSWLQYLPELEHHESAVGVA
jgi:5-methylcytosine-specific restriction endonuclease McrA